MDIENRCRMECLLIVLALCVPAILSCYFVQDQKEKRLTRQDCLPEFYQPSAKTPPPEFRETFYQFSPNGPFTKIIELKRD